MRRVASGALGAALVLLAVSAPPVQAQQAAGTRGSPADSQAVLYEVAFPDAVHHTARVTVTFRGLPPGQPLHARMARSSAGRYALHDFAKNVYAVAAEDSRGRRLVVTRPDPSGWDVSGHDGTVRLSYTLFGDHADGTYAGIDSTHAHFNMPAAFMYARGLEQRPIRITFHPVHGWTVATQLVPVCEPPQRADCRTDSYRAPQLDYFFDSPTELSRHDVEEWREGPGGRYTFRAAIHHLGTEQDARRFAGMLQRVVAEEAAVFGELPAYDYGGYTFIFDFLPWVYGDGMEHRNSTLITGRVQLAGGGALRDLGTATHEFFHCWNMERLRDRAIEPFDFGRPNSSPDLWFGEGFTSYYTTLIRARAGFLTPEAAAGEWGRVVSSVVGSPARRFRSAVQMSEYAPFADAAVSIDLVDYDNTFLSYYSWGDAIGLALDLTLRERFHGSLDDYMRLLWREYGRLQAGERPQRPYTTTDLRRALAELTGDSAFAGDFFRAYIEGRDVPDYASLLGPAGLLLRGARPGTAWLGLSRAGFGPEGATVQGPTLIGSPLYRAGVDNGDLITTLDGRAVTGAAGLDSLLAAHRPGETIALGYVQRGETKQATVVLAPDPELEIVTYEQAGLPVTPAMRAFRSAWLGSRAQGTETRSEPR